MMRARGFTLLELIIAIAIFAVLSIMAYSGLSNALNTREHTERVADRLAAVQQTYTILQRDLEQAAPRDVRDSFGDTRPGMIGGTGDALIEFSRTGWRNPVNRPRSHLQRVAYRVDDGRLIRMSWAALDRAPDSTPLEQVLLEGVDAAEVRFLAPPSAVAAAGTTPQNEWQSYWPPQTPGAAPPVTPLPRAVEVSLDLKDWGRITRLFRVPG